MRSCPTSCATRLPLWCVGLLLFTLGSAHAQPVKLRVRGSAVLEGRAVPRDVGMEIHGVLKDDTGRPIGRADVRAVSAGRTLPAPGACRSTASAQVHSSRGEVVVQTDGAGAFCFQLPGEPPAGALALRFAGDPFFDAAEIAVPLDPKRRALLLRFAPEKSVLPLERSEHAISVETRVEPPFGPGEGAEGVPLVLELVTTEGAAPLTRATLVAGDRVALKVPSAALGPPGTARLRARFPGTALLTAAEVSMPVLKTAVVRLSAAGAAPSARSGDLAQLSVAVGSSVGAVPSGGIELLAAGRSLGTAAVEAGSARWEGRLDLEPGPASLTVHYLPDVPWWAAGEPLAVAVEVQPPSPWRSTPWLIGAALLALWMLRSWLRPGRREKRREPRAEPAGRASIDVIRAGDPASGWTGVVIDAHDAAPIADAEVRLVLPSFQQEDVARRDRTDAQGRFRLDAAARAEGARLVVEAAHHTRLERSAPAPGELVIQLVGRRRAILARLVEWAERRGAPWKQTGEPTPGEVRRVALGARDEPARAWAEEVEAAAFGPEPPDLAAEKRISEREPPTARQR